jgi:hypothetical protein
VDYKTLGKQEFSEVEPNEAGGACDEDAPRLVFFIIHRKH